MLKKITIEVDRNWNFNPDVIQIRVCLQDDADDETKLGLVRLIHMEDLSYVDIFDLIWKDMGKELKEKAVEVFRKEKE